MSAPAKQVVSARKAAEKRPTPADGGLRALHDPEAVGLDDEDGAEE